MDPKSKNFIAFLTPWGFYEWVCIPFGEYRDDFVIIHLDNLLLYSGKPSQACKIDAAKVKNTQH